MTAREFKTLRHMAGLTQEQAARLLEVAHRTVLRYEHGETRIGPLRAQAIRLRLSERAFKGGDLQTGEGTEKDIIGR